MQNFAFEYNGKTYWYSRSMTTVGYIFAKSKKKGWCVLANKRGPGCPSNIGKWNVPCGYLEHNVNARENCCKEILEESGVVIEPEQLKFLQVQTLPNKGKQNVNLIFYSILKEEPESLTLSKEYSEPGEVDIIAWIPIDDLSKYDFAFFQRPKIFTIFEKYINVSFFKKMILKILCNLNKKFLIQPTVD